ncbi:MAG: type II toxin-antitoxin system VapC family toxin [Opitutus sp.]|nr:type II toxin-antitoxin system VapC family toxin [Opitutus sp.]MCS6247505.1 type II toxin-antitoxin system VapC family toxin [Opitutus sp.]MCS6273885.1 type II toxin-antitoxin system VapC family toxin [Opitutus sp.]MCS6278229.1 type II toxin-antitoxin system VapC family toxin [Opitutus sp.]MCS6299339.1 type II toxin-antitoxin system VapC family toxin [Opitutus sp.]
MNLLLDTHVVLWWLDDHPRLSRAARQAIRNPANRCWLSAVTVFEVETKHRLGKLALPSGLQLGWDNTVKAERWSMLPVDHGHARQAGRYSLEHGDPFDRLLAAQAEIENAVLITWDPAFASFGIRTLW